MYRFEVVLVVAVAILLPTCYTLTSNEQKQLDKFDAQIANLKLKLQNLKGDLVTKVERLNKDITAQYDNINGDLLLRINRTKTKRSDTMTKINNFYKTKTFQYRSQLRKKTQNLMNAQYQAQYNSALASRNSAVNPLVGELNKIRNAMRKPMGKFNSTERWEGVTQLLFFETYGTF